MKIRNRQTGQIVEIDENQAGQYGISQDAVNAFRAQQVATPSATQPDLTQPSQLSEQQVKQSPEIEKMQKLYQNAWKNAPIKGSGVTQSSIADTWQKTFGFDLFGSPTTTDYDAISEVYKQGGGDLLAKVKDKESRLAVAKEIMDSGGVKEYRKVLPLTDLLNDDEVKGRNASVDLLTQIDAALPNFSKNMWFGTGPIVGKLAGVPFTEQFLGEQTRKMIGNVEQIRSFYQQMISGKVVSDREAERLKTFLPTKDYSELSNRDRLQRLRNRIAPNLELFEVAKREGLDINEAYNKYGKDIFAKYKVDINANYEKETGISLKDEEIIKQYKK